MVFGKVTRILTCNWASKGVPVQKGETSEEKLQGEQQEECLPLFVFIPLKADEFLGPNVVRPEGRNCLPNPT